VTVLYGHIHRTTCIRGERCQPPWEFFFNSNV
jgi:hypothetical protein